MITRDMSIFETIARYPQTREIFKKYGMHCLECMGATAESIAAGAKMHGVDLEKLLAELNQTVSSN